MAKNEIFQRWLKHPSYDAYWQSMTPDPKEYSKINIPILTYNRLFRRRPAEVLCIIIKSYKSTNPNADHYVVIGPYDHLWSLRVILLPKLWSVK